MKLFKLPLIPVLLIFISCVMIATIPACSAQSDADKITENVLRAINEGNYDNYLQYFYEEARSNIQCEEDWDADVAAVERLYGEYEINSLKYWKTETENSNTVVYYKTRFTKSSEVIFKSVFQDVEGKDDLVGLLLVQE